VPWPQRPLGVSSVDAMAQHPQLTGAVGTDR
jgi:hypothetical protein